MNYKWFNYPQMVKSNADHFGLILFYDSAPGKHRCEKRFENRRSHLLHTENLHTENLHTKNMSMKGMTASSLTSHLSSSGLICLQLPLSFTLMTVGQMQILNTTKFGDLTVTSMIDRGYQKMRINNLIGSYQEHIQKEESAGIERWFDQVHQQFCQ